jgi:hypothetical protein
MLKDLAYRARWHLSILPFGAGPVVSTSLLADQVRFHARFSAMGRDGGQHEGLERAAAAYFLLRPRYSFVIGQFEYQVSLFLHNA